MASLQAHVAQETCCNRPCEPSLLLPAPLLPADRMPERYQSLSEQPAQNVDAHTQLQPYSEAECLADSPGHSPAAQGVLVHYKGRGRATSGVMQAALSPAPLGESGALAQVTQVATAPRVAAARSPAGRATFTGPPAPPQLAVDIVQPLRDLGIDLASCNVTDPRYRYLLRLNHHQAVSLVDFVRKRSPLPVCAYNSLRALVNKCLVLNQMGPPPPDDFVIQILKPLLDAGFPLEGFNVNNGAGIARPLHQLNPKVPSLAHFVGVGGTYNIASLNGLRKLVAKIARREGLPHYLGDRDSALEAVHARTARADHRVQSAVARVQALLADSDASGRGLAHRCKPCYYVPYVGGHVQVARP